MDCTKSGLRYSRQVCPEYWGKSTKQAEQPKQKQIVEPYQESTFGWLRRKVLNGLYDAGIYVPK